MPNYKPKMHKQMGNRVEHKWFAWSECGHVMPVGSLVKKWSDTECGNCLRTKGAPKQEVEDETKK